MTKAELTERIVDALVDPWTDNLEDYADLAPIDLEVAKGFLNEIRNNESSADLEPDECLPEDVTPVQIQETWNCLIRAKKHELRIKQIADYFEEHHDFLVYSYTYLTNCHPLCAPTDMVPTDFFVDHLEEGSFYFDTKDRTFTKQEVLKIFADSLNKIDLSEPYICFHDYGMTQSLITCDDPTDAVDVDDFAMLIVEDKESFEYFVKEIVEDDDAAEEIFHCTKEEVLK